MFSNSFSTKLLYIASILMLSVLVSTLISCNSKSNEKASATEKIELKQPVDDRLGENNTDSFQLLEYSCLYCHAMQVSENNMSSLQTITETYKKTYPLKADFVKSFIGLTEHTSNEAMLMKTNAKQECVLMQDDSELPKENITDIAVFLFDYEFYPEEVIK